nr:uncharacterized protein LOC109175178 [Ipomoea batatas]
MNDEFNTPTGPSTDTTPNLTQQTQPAEQQENVDEEPQQKESQRIGQDDEEQHPIQMQIEQTPAKEPQRPETRMERRQVKATNPLKSPYLTRQIDTKRPWTATEKIIGKWVLQNDNVYPTRIIFKHGAYAVIWDDMLSLNKNEEIKLYTVVAPYGDDALRSKKFSERMDDEIGQTEGLNLQDIELNKRFDILDNSSAESPKNEKYADVPTTLRTMQKSKLVRGLTPARLGMSWRDNNNKVECGVFTMRHMETYMGKGTKGWECGLEKENKEQLNNTRVKYLAEIVNSPINEFREDCMKDARQFEKASKAKK